MKLGVLNPGAMGVSVGAALVSNGHEVFWLAEGRSPATRERAEQHGLIAVSTMTELVDSVAGIVSVCPPHGALELAEQVMAAGFEGIYLDGNAVSPETARNIHALVGETFVDGGIVGPPALRAGTTRLYLSGQRAAEAQEWFTGSNLVTTVVSSKMPMQYTSWHSRRSC